MDSAEVEEVSIEEIETTEKDDHLYVAFLLNDSNMSVQNRDGGSFNRGRGRGDFGGRRGGFNRYSHVRHCSC